MVKGPLGFEPVTFRSSMAILWLGKTQGHHAQGGRSMWHNVSYHISYSLDDISHWQQAEKYQSAGTSWDGKMSLLFIVFLCATNGFLTSVRNLIARSWLFKVLCFYNCFDYLQQKAVPVESPNILNFPGCGIITSKDLKWPWMAAILRDGDYFCGGSVITDRHILTGTSCVRK
jgi:hypothetical protein